VLTWCTFALSYLNVRRECDLCLLTDSDMSTVD